MPSARSNLGTVAAIAVVAYAGCDMVHELLGHGLACALHPGVRALSLSTVALQTDVASRSVASAGTIANVAAGLLALLLFRAGRAFGPGRYALWLFATTNLLNGTGYPLFSALFDFGDWAVVIAGLAHHGAWRLVLGAVGLLLYAGTIRIMAAQLVASAERGELDPHDLPRLIFPAYVAGGMLFVAGAALNPVGPQLILSSGVSSGFGAMAGLALVPRLVEARTAGSAGAAPALRRSVPWIVAGILAALIFVGLIGPGVSLS